MIELDYAAEKAYKDKLDALAKENKALMEDLETHKNEYTIEEQLDIIGKGIKICDEMAKLETEHKEWLLDQLDKAGIEAIQSIINMMFGIGA